MMILIIILTNIAIIIHQHDLHYIDHYVHQDIHHNIIDYTIAKLINTILIYLVFYQSDISWQSVSTDQLFSSCNVTSSPNGVDTSTYKALTLAIVAADG